MSDTTEPTNLERKLLIRMDNSATDEDAVALLRAHVAAEVAKATGELLNDKERLDWLIANSAYVAHSRDGEVCWLMMRPDEESDFETVPGTTRITARESIDAASELESEEPRINAAGDTW